MTEITGKTTELPRRSLGAAAAALGLMAGGDYLILAQAPGINISLLLTLIAAAITALGWRGANRKTLVLGLGAYAISVLPLIEAPSLLGFLSGSTGLAILALAASSQLPRIATELPSVLARFAALAPFRLPGDALAGVREGGIGGAGAAASREALAWIVPGILAVVFVLLFASANPLIDSVLRAANLDDLLRLFDPWRVAFWGLFAGFAWPFLRPRLLRWDVPQMQGPLRPRAESLIFGRAAILRSLVVFNALFAAQTAMDIAYLWGGVALPEGMSYADYAHRGAYPLIVTALLAAGFVLAAMRPSGAAERSRLIRGLVYLFIAQNVLLVVSSILRLDLYVEVYSLTGLRLAAGIWMGLVAAGLMLILARIALRRSNKWLVAMNLGALAATLYVCAFLDFGAMISRFNAEHGLAKGVQAVDLYYLGQLGPSAIPAIDLLLEKSDGTGPEVADLRGWRKQLADDLLKRDTGWRSWSLRKARLQAYLSGAPIDTLPGSGQNRLSTP